MDQDQHEFLNRDVISMKGELLVGKKETCSKYLTEGNRKIKVEREARILESWFVTL